MNFIAYEMILGLRERERQREEERKREVEAWKEEEREELFQFFPMN